MSIQTLVNNLLAELRGIGLEGRTVRKDYASFYRPLCAESGGLDEGELDESLLRNFCVRTLGKDVWELPRLLLSRREQRCVHAFRVLCEYQRAGQVKVVARIKEDVLDRGSQAALDAYIAMCRDAGNSPRTYGRKSATIRRFLTVVPLGAVNRPAILSYIRSFAGKSTYYQKRELDEIQRFLLFCFQQAYTRRDYSVVFPKIHTIQDPRLPSGYSCEERKSMLQYLSGHVSPNRRRNYAMALLAAVYSLRPVDISTLKYSDIDFGEGCIKLAKAKAGTPSCLPLVPHVGNALVDYILEERPAGPSELLFLKSDGTGLSVKSIGNIIRDAIVPGWDSMEQTTSKGEYSIFTIVGRLGKITEQTAHTYGKVDLARLACCALEMPSVGGNRRKAPLPSVSEGVPALRAADICARWSGGGYTYALYPYGSGNNADRPYIFSRKQVRKLLEQAVDFNCCYDKVNPNMKNVVACLYALLYCTGIRISEALALRLADVSVEERTILVTEARGGRQRLVPISESLSERCADYLAQRCSCHNIYFFDSGAALNGGQIKNSMASWYFNRLLELSGIPRGGRGGGPRLQNLRDTFALHSLRQLIRHGDVNRSLEYLSLYMGQYSVYGPRGSRWLTDGLAEAVLEKTSISAFVAEGYRRKEVQDYV